VPFVAGPHLNIYNLPTLQWMAGLGAMRWVMPLEMGAADLALLQPAARLGLQTEVFAYGRMPLAFSARCFTARHHNLPKDDCQFSCLDHPDGLMLQDPRGRGFLVLNGIQTQSARVYNLLANCPAACSLGVDVLRISPQSQHMARSWPVPRRAGRQAVCRSEAQAQHAPLMPAQGLQRLLAWSASRGMALEADAQGACSKCRFLKPPDCRLNFKGLRPCKPPSHAPAAPVGDVLARLPAWPGSLLFVTALNLALARQLPVRRGRHAARTRSCASMCAMRAWPSTLPGPAAALPPAQPGRRGARPDHQRQRARLLCCWPSASKTPTRCSSAAAWPWKATPSWA
jgi:hypothetical protein